MASSQNSSAHSQGWSFDEPSRLVHDRILRLSTHPIISFLKKINREARGEKSLCVLAGSALANVLLGDCMVDDTFHIYSYKELQDDDILDVLQQSGWFATDIDRYRMENGRL